jgi:hypothetical protein
MTNIIGGTVVWDLDVDSKGLSSGLVKANKQISEFANKAASSMKKASDSMVASMKRAEQGSKMFTKGVAAAGVAVAGLVVKTTLTAARTETLGVAMNAVAKATGNSVEELAKQETIMKKQGIATQEARTILTKFMQSQLDVADASKISRVAQDLAVIAGKNSSETAETLTTAISNQNVLMLRQFGIVANADDIFDKYAKTLGKGTATTELNTAKTAKNVEKLANLRESLKIARMRRDEFTESTKASTKASANLRIDKLKSQISSLSGNTQVWSKVTDKAADSLTAAQKKQAFLNEILEQGAKASGTYEAAMETAGKKLGSMDRHFQEAANTIGTVFLPAFGDLIDLATEFLKKVTTENVEAVFKAIVEWGPVIAGVIVGGVVPALVLLGKAALVAMAPLLPWIALGAAIGLAVVVVIKVFKGLGEFLPILGDVFGRVFEVVKTKIEGFLEGTKKILTKVVDAVWKFIKAVTAPWRWLYTNVIEPVLLLISAVILRVFFEIGKFVKEWSSRIFNWLNDKLFRPVKDLWIRLVDFTQRTWQSIKDKIMGPVRSATDGVTSLFDRFVSWIKGIWNGIVDFFKGIASSIVSAISKPFDDAKKKVEKTAEKIRRLADKINPFHRESPSLVDNVRRGLGIIKREFASLGTLSIESPSFDSPVASAITGDNFEGSRGGDQFITIEKIEVRDEQDIQALGREFAFRAKIAGAGI